MARRTKSAATDSCARSARFEVVFEMFADARCSVVVGATLADAWARARADWPSIDRSHDSGDEACVIEVDDQCVMLLSEQPTFEVFAHESVHVAAWLMRSRGIPFMGKNEEVVAYAVQWVVRHGWTLASAWSSSSDVTSLA